MKGLDVDLVIWNEDDSVYRQVLQDRDHRSYRGQSGSGVRGQAGRRVCAPGRADVRGGPGPTANRGARGPRGRCGPTIRPGGTARPARCSAAGIQAVEAAESSPRPVVEMPHRDLAFFNGLGGFSRDGREYITILGKGKNTPAPWVNVIANPQFGTVVSESGAGYTWAENSHEFRLTPWYNDPVSDTSGEAMYIRDEETGRFWSPSPLPARGNNPYVARHGFGYSIFEYADEGVFTELCLFVATDAPVKLARLRIRNHSGQHRKLSVTAFWEWVLGDLRYKTLMHVVTDVDPVSDAPLHAQYLQPGVRGPARLCRLQ